jgi:curved DNA-binding protein CbpA
MNMGSTSFVDYYQVLELERGASHEEVKRAFRRLAMRYHPDRNPQDTRQAEERFKQINEAYEVLGDEEKRRRYDYLASRPMRPRQAAMDDYVFVDLSQEGLSAEALQQLLEELAALGLSFRRSVYKRGCRRGFGRWCSRPDRWL